jgi:virginiamycin B lyase
LPDTSVALYITAGSDGNLWFTVYGDSKIGKITTAGAITEYASVASGPAGITSGPGGLWFASQGSGSIAQTTLSGTITSYPLPSATSNPVGIVTGPDGNLWFTEYGGNKIGKIVP